MRENFLSNKQKEKEPRVSDASNKIINKAYFQNILTEIYNLPLQNQILGFFLLFYIMYLIFIIFMKYSKLNDVTKEISDISYFKTVGVEYLANISETYETLHSISFDSNMTHFTRGMNFFNIYSRELNRINVNLLENNTSFPYELSSLNNIFFDNKNYDIQEHQSFVLRKKFSEYFEKMNFNPSQATYNNSLLFPLFYANIPHLIKDAQYHNLYLQSVLIVSSAFTNDKCRPNTTPSYFMVPNLIDNTMNFDFLDDIIDPHSYCETTSPHSLESEDDNLNNFYQIFEKNFALEKNSLSCKKILNAFQETLDDQHYKNYLSYISANKISRKGPFSSDIQNDILSFGFYFKDNFSDVNLDNTIMGHFSIFYFNNNLIKGFEKRDSPKISYGVINLPNTVITIPPFLENLYVYGVKTERYFSEYSDDEKAIINTEKIFAVESDDKLVNEIFKNDQKIFRLISFLEKSYMANQENELCSIDEYLDLVLDLSPADIFDCFKDVCFFNNCMGDEQFFDPAEYQKGYISCKCLPLYCGDYLKNKIKSAIDKIEKPNQSRSFIHLEQLQTYEVYKEFNDTITERSFSLDYFKSLGKESSLKCKLWFSQKQFYENNIDQQFLDGSLSYYKIDISASKKPFSTDGVFIIAYLYNLNDFIYILFKHFYFQVELYNFYLFMTYLVLIFMLSSISLANFFRNLTVFRERISGLSEYNILSAINRLNERKIFKRINRHSMLQDNEVENYLTTENCKYKATQLNEEKLEAGGYKDELEDIRSFILDNLNKFCVSFTSKETFHEKHPLLVKYINKIQKEIMIKINFDEAGYSKKIVNQFFPESYLNFFLIENISDKDSMERQMKKNYEDKKAFIKEYDIDKNAIYRDYSCLLLIELISTDIELKYLFTNFFYKDPLSQENKFDLYNLMEKLEDDDQVICESSNLQKMEKFVSFVNEVVDFKWHLELQKNLFNEYYHSLYINK